MLDISQVQITAEYTINELGYRAPAFDKVDWSNSFIIQGCSQVFGLGTNQDDKIVSHYLSQLLNAPVINLGAPGAGMEVQYTNALYMLEQDIRPRGVFIIYPNMDRYSWYKDSEIKFMGSWSDDKNLLWMMNGNSRTHNINLMRGYKLLWRFAQVPLYEWSHHKDNASFCNTVIEWDSFLDLGFDNQHWGPKTSNAIAEILFDQLQKQGAKTAG